MAAVTAAVGRLPLGMEVAARVRHLCLDIKKLLQC